MSSRRRTIISIAALFLGVSLLTACTVSASGGIAGAILSILALVAALMAGGSQTACSIGPCLDIAFENENMGPCLSLPPENYNQGELDAGPDDVDDERDATFVGPCLSILPNYDQGDIGVGDTGDLDVSDDGDVSDTGAISDTGDVSDDGDVSDTGDVNDDTDAMGALDERQKILAKMSDRLPEDVLRRLQKNHG